MSGYRTRGAGTIGAGDVGAQVTLAGWVATVRDHGGLQFIDLRDSTGLAQIVFDPQADSDLSGRARRLSAEDVVRVTGEVRPRPPGTENAGLSSGAVEVGASSLEVINESAPLPFALEENVEASEEIRLKYRYLDLRRPGGRRGLDLRHAVMHTTRNHLAARGFLEVETPILWKPTPEGSREFVVPSRNTPGKFYVLPQSPQLVKQTLMVAGVEKYFQIARCFRDEDLRADRQPEFTQIDIEMAFVTEDDVLGTTEDLMGEIFRAAGKDLPRPVPRMTFREAMERFGTDKPDMRFAMEIADVGGRLKSCAVDLIRKSLDRGGKVKALALPVSASEIPRSALDALDEFARAAGAKGVSWFACGGGQASPLMKRLTDEERAAVAADCGARPGEMVFASFDSSPQVEEFMGALRLELARRHGLVRPELKPVWVREFPLVTWNADEKRLEATHHPFTRPFDEDLELLAESPERARGHHYDFVINGEEIWGGSLRIYKPDLQRRMFEIIGMTPAAVEERFGFLLRAFEYGAPPHGGIACGMDRLVMLLGGYDSIRETIAFPKTQRGMCALSGAPGGVDEKQLRDLHVKVVEPKRSESK